YPADAKLGVHQDGDVGVLSAPVVSGSLGDVCLFRVGQTTRDGATKHDDIAALQPERFGGEGRLAFHGVDRIYPSPSALGKNGGRMNLTLRRVTKPPEEPRTSR
ncbi:alpha-ketoglutarate-dependent dioxygenase AlkB, partial [Mesorhizobium japonicum]|uniref:alpha-ketoglutarate-dependent dioxygenase AlkB n=1 Tax=Mesorhizobium japonicum TaxID=2066070 RepID=UPI003B595151